MHLRVLGLMGITILMAAEAGYAQSPDFNREVRPILSAHCFKCHGPDESQRKAGLRLDTTAGAEMLLASGKRAIVSRNAAKSTLITRILSHGSDTMPPAYANKPLTDSERAILRKWVAGGAVYKPHWAFVRPVQAAFPKVKQTAWVRNPIDGFILSRIEKAGLRPSPPADRYTLIRRLSLDLIGLPPTPDEADAFVKDKRPDAYEKLVDRLLASPHYGERWARRWLDLARYADTNGYEKDRVRSIWPYRDWVIDALNQDMPFNQFTIEQIAGDMLPNPTRDQRIATGFHRNTMLNEEGGIDPQEYQFYSMVDRVATTGTTWLGLTLGCAQCHTHKFDPITQKEYYRVMAFFNNVEDQTVDVSSPDLAKKRAELLAQIHTHEMALSAKFQSDMDQTKDSGVDLAELHRWESVRKEFAQWLSDGEMRAVKWKMIRPVKAVSNLPMLSVQSDSSIFVSGDESKRDLYTLDFKADSAPITGIRLEALPDDRLPAHGPGRVFYEGALGDFFLSEITLSAGGKSVPFAEAFKSGGGDVKTAIDGDPQTGWNINGRQGMTTTAVFRLSKPVPGAEFTIQLLFERYHAADLGHFRISITTDTKQLQVDLHPEVEAALKIPSSDRSDVERDILRKYYLSIAPQYKVERDAIADLRSKMPTFPTSLTFSERPANNPRLTYIHHRGEYLQRKEQVSPGLPAILPSMPKGVPSNRLGFARWLVSFANPLTARVTINRQWAVFFGRGIVRTLQDFGYQGDPPTHPELLDWMAVEFMKQGWSIKKMHRLIVTSAAYRQSSHMTPELITKDAENRLLTRAPRVRLEAELVRDSVLASSGLLSSKIGGQSVFPSQPPGITSEGTYGTLDWKVSTGEDRYRRGMYTFSKRTAPYAMFATFDAPSGEACVARRDVSNTPLQALTLLNDQLLIESARALGKTVSGAPGSEIDHAINLFRRCLTRPPNQAEIQMMTQFLTVQRKRFETGELDSIAIAGNKEGDTRSQSVFTALARVLLNLDEAINKP